MAITAAMIKELREATGAGILDSKKALEANDGDFDKAVEFLREKGLAKAAKKASREANEGLVVALVDGKNAALVAVNCETDFVARTDDFKTFAESLAQQVLANPALTSVEAMLAAPSTSNPEKTVADDIQEAISKLGENIILRNVARYTQTGPGVIEGYVHLGGKIGVLAEISVDDASAEGDALTELAHDITLQIAAARPQYLSREDVPAEIIEKERNILLAQLENENKPDNIKQRIVEGRLNKFYKEVCLLDQPFVKDDSLSIAKLLAEAGKKLGTTVKINRYTRFELGAS